MDTYLLVRNSDKNIVLERSNIMGVIDYLNVTIDADGVINSPTWQNISRYNLDYYSRNMAMEDFSKSNQFNNLLRHCGYSLYKAECLV